MELVRRSALLVKIPQRSQIISKFPEQVEESLQFRLVLFSNLKSCLVLTIHPIDIDHFQHV